MVLSTREAVQQRLVFPFATEAVKWERLADVLRPSEYARFYNGEVILAISTCGAEHLQRDNRIR